MRIDGPQSVQCGGARAFGQHVLGSELTSRCSSARVTMASCPSSEYNRLLGVGDAAPCVTLAVPTRKGAAEVDAAADEEDGPASMALGEG